MNEYRMNFCARCPVNGDTIDYAWRIQSARAIMAEEIIAATEGLQPAIHEDLADMLFRRFGGVQTITARHRAVTITTTRGLT